MSFTVSVESVLAPAAAPRAGSADPSPPEAFALERLTRIRRTVGTVPVQEATIATLECLSEDPANLPRLLAWLREGLARNDRRHDLRSAVRAIARVLEPRTILEVGTRRGWSLAQACAEAPEARIWSVDLWTDPCDGAPNPGPEFVHAEIGRAAPGFQGKITYIDGNSHDVLPVFLDGCFDPSNFPDELPLVRESEARPRRFDLVILDGDRTAQGAWWDLHDLFPRVALGGALVFADLVDRSGEADGERARAIRPPRVPTPPDLRCSRLDVWNRIQALFPEFAFVSDVAAPSTVGIAVRLR